MINAFIAIAVCATCFFLGRRSVLEREMPITGRILSTQELDALLRPKP